MTEKQYPELPTHFMLVQESFRDEVYLYTADQMRAYADADRAMRAAQRSRIWATSFWFMMFSSESQVPPGAGCNLSRLHACIMGQILHLRKQKNIPDKPIGLCRKSVRNQRTVTASRALV